MKNFLKPTKAKLTIFGLIFLLGIFLPGAVFETEIEYLKIIEIVLCPHYLLYNLIVSPDTPDIVFHAQTILLSVLAFIVGVIYWYLISCLIVFIYERFKEKLRKK